VRLLAGVLHSDEIVWNSYTWDADAHKQINTKSQNSDSAINNLRSNSVTTYVSDYGHTIQFTWRFTGVGIRSGLYVRIDGNSEFGPIVGG